MRVWRLARWLLLVLSATTVAAAIWAAVHADYTKAWWRYRRGDLPGCIAACTQTIDAHPSARAYCLRASAYLRMPETLPAKGQDLRACLPTEEVRLAVDDFNSALRLTPRSGPVRARAAKAYQMRGAAYLLLAADDLGQEVEDDTRDAALGDRILGGSLYTMKNAVDAAQKTELAAQVSLAAGTYATHETAWVRLKDKWNKPFAPPSSVDDPAAAAGQLVDGWTTGQREGSNALKAVSDFLVAEDLNPTDPTPHYLAAWAYAAMAADSAAEDELYWWHHPDEYFRAVRERERKYGPTPLPFDEAPPTAP